MKFQPAELNIGMLKINTIGQCCKLTMSSSIQTGLRHTIKKTQGFGEHNADGCVFALQRQGVNDTDLKDG